METTAERMEQELREVKRLKRCLTLRECPVPHWKLIEDKTVTYKGQTFDEKLWVAVCGGAVEYTEDITPEGKRVYQVERFELKPESWARERVIQPPCSMIVTDRYDTKEEAEERVKFHKESIVPFWWKVKESVGAIKEPGVV